LPGSGLAFRFSNARRIRRRISIASSRLFNPGRARFPLVVAEVGVPRSGRHDEEVVRERPSARSTSRAAGSTATASARKTSVFFCRRRMERIG
jgi:hypothetical protein